MASGETGRDKFCDLFAEIKEELNLPFNYYMSKGKSDENDFSVPLSNC